MAKRLQPQDQNHELWDEVRNALQSIADPALAQQYMTIAPTRGRVLGIKVPNIRALVKEFAASNKHLAPADAVALADVAFASDCREEMLFATFFLARYKSKFEATHWNNLNRWIDRIDNWETCDQLAMGVAGEMLARAAESQQKKWIKDLESWAKSPNAWRRRFALATTTVLNQKGRKDAQTTLRICQILVTDTDKSVQKAVGWAFREACKSDPDAVFAALKKHQARMPRSVLRESAEKLSAAQRATLGLSS